MLPDDPRPAREAAWQALRAAFETHGDQARAAVLAAISEARETRHVEPGRAGEIFQGVIDLASHLHHQASLLS
jgi:hypothetical protein